MKRLLQFRALAFVFLMALFPLTGAQCGVAPQYKSGPSTEVAFIPGVGVNWNYGQFPYTPLTFAGDLFDQINIYRSQNGRPALKWHDGMALVAQKHALDMHNRNYLALVSPEGIDIAERLVSSYPRIDFDESYSFVAYTQTPTQVFSQLMNDVNSRMVIDDGSVSHFGASFQSNPGPYHVAIIFAVNAKP